MKSYGGNPTSVPPLKTIDFDIENRYTAGYKHENLPPSYDKAFGTFASCLLISCQVYLFYRDESKIIHYGSETINLELG